MQTMFTRREIMRKAVATIRANFRLTEKYLSKNECASGFYHYETAMSVVHVLYMIDVLPADKVGLLQKIIGNMFFSSST